MWKAGRWLKAAGNLKRGCSEGELSAPCKGLVHAAARPKMREECGLNLVPLRPPQGLIKGVQSKGLYRCQPGAIMQSRQCRLHNAPRAWVRNWAPVITVAQTKPPSLWSHRQGKMEPSSPLPAGTGKIRKTNWAGLKINTRLFFFFSFFPPQE